MRLKSIRQAKNLNGKRVFLRAGFDVPFDAKGKIADDMRIVQSLATIRYLISKKSKVIIGSHNGRPKGKVVKRLKMDEVARHLERLLKKKVTKLDDCIGKDVKEHIKEMRNGDVVLLENLRFHIGEEKNYKSFAQQLADLADVYVNDAFSNSHRDHASMTGVAKILPCFAGLLLVKEVRILDDVLTKPKRPVVAVIGGVKISSKLGAILYLLKKIDYILLGGALANTVLKAHNVAIGKSLMEKDMIAEVKKIDITHKAIKIPVDVIISNDMKNGKVIAVAQVPKKGYIVDIGPDTVVLYTNIIKSAKTVIFAGPMGMFEIKAFSYGTKSIIRAIESNRKAFTIAGGGSTLSAIDHLGNRKHFNYLSTGGGAMLEFLEGKMLPGLKPLVVN